MKLLIDFSQIAYMTYFSTMRDTQDLSESSGLLKHLMINIILQVKRKFGVSASEIYICADHKISWRRQIFPHYKAKRRKNREDSKADFKALYDLMDSFYLDLKKVFPFHVIRTKYAEGDDCIGCLANHFSELGEDFAIVSSDNDFVQLQSLNGFICQFDPIHKKNIKSDRPKKELFIKILNGDTGDGIPNVLSDDDTFVCDHKRQRPLGEKKCNHIVSTNETLKEFLKDPSIMKRFKQNRRLIDLSKIPQQVKDKILTEYMKSSPNRNLMNLEAYFHGAKMIMLENRMNEFK